MNSVVLIGRLAKDPDIRSAQSGTAVCRITVAVDRPPRQGEEKQADFIQVATFGKTAENIGKYMRKGRQAAVQGRIQTGSYKNREGQTVYTTEVIADRVEFIGSAHEEKHEEPKRQEQYKQQEISEYYDDDLPDAFASTDEEIPF